MREAVAATGDLIPARPQSIGESNFAPTSPNFRAEQEAGTEPIAPLQDDDIELIDISGLPFEAAEKVGIEDEDYEFEIAEGRASVRVAGSKGPSAEVPRDRLDRLKKAGEEIGDAMHPARLGILDGAGAGITDVQISDESAREIAEFVADFMPGLSVPLALNDARIAAQAAYLAYQSGDLSDGTIAAAIAIVSLAGVVPVVRKATKFIARAMQAARVKRRERFRTELTELMLRPRPSSGKPLPPIDAKTLRAKIKRGATQRGILGDFVSFALSPKTPGSGRRLVLDTGTLPPKLARKIQSRLSRNLSSIFEGQVKDLRLFIDDDQIRHAWNTHGLSSSQEPRIRRDDFKHVFGLLKGPSKIEHRVYLDHLQRRQVDGITIRKRIGDSTLVLQLGVVPKSRKQPAHFRFGSLKRERPSK